MQLKRSKIKFEFDLSDVSPSEFSKDGIRRLILAGPKTKRKFKVARRLPNVRQPPPPSYFGFVYNIEHPALPDHDDSPSMIHIDMETIHRDWFLDLWKDELVPRGGDELLRLFQRSKTGIFSDDFHQFGYPERKLIYDLHSYFSQRLLDEADPAPVAILEVDVAVDDWFLRYLEGAHWYQFNLRPTPTGATWADFDASGDSLPDHHALISELAMDAAFDPPPQLKLMRGFGFHPVDDYVLKALHLPQWDPPPPPPPPVFLGGFPSGHSPGTGGGGSTSGSNFGNSFATPIGQRVLDWLRGAWNAAENVVAQWLGPPQPWGRLALAGGVPSAMLEPASAATPADRDESCSYYHGRPFAGGGMPQVADPIVMGVAPLNHQPFVGVLNIGQGNMNVVYGSAGKPVAYYDFGFPKTSEKKTAPTLQYAPCLHDDPLAVLSHWDWDHYSMARRVRSSWDLRWIVPQQHIGSAATREVYARIVASATGEVHLWAAAAPGAAVSEHLRLPWGYLERGITNDHLGTSSEDLNDGGLVMYVCVESAGGPPGATPNVAAPLNARGGPAPPITQARTCADAAANAANGVHFSAMVDAVANAAERATLQFGPTGVNAAQLVAAASAACGMVVATQGGWGAAFAGMHVAATDPISLAAGALVGQLGGAVTAAAAVGGVMGPLVLGPHTAATFALAAALADAAQAALPLAPGGFALGAGAVLVAAQAAAQAVADDQNGGPLVAGPLGFPVPATSVQVTALNIDLQLRYAAAAAASGSAEATILAGNAPALLAANIAHATAAVVGICTAGASAGVAKTWQHALGALVVAQGIAGLNPVHAGAGFLTGNVGGPAATMSATVDASPALPFVGAVANIERTTAAAALCDAVPEGLATSAAIAARAGQHGVGDAQARAGAGRAANPLQWNAAGGAVANAAVDRGFELGEQVLPRETHAAGREAARSVAIKMGVADMPREAAPLDPVGGVAVFGGIAIPTAAAIAGGGAGATPLVNVQGGASPVSAAERYIQLTGDVGPVCIPTQRMAAAGWPKIVGFTPSHHGANSCLTCFEETSCIPWAPGSAAAAAGAAAAVVHGAGGSIDCQAAAAAGAYVGARVAHLVQQHPVSNVTSFAEIASAAVTVDGVGVFPGWAGCLAPLSGSAGCGRLINAAAAGLATLPGLATIAAAIGAAQGGLAPALALVVAARRVAAHPAGGGLAAAHVAAGAANLVPGGGGPLPGLGGGVGPVVAAMGNAVDQAVTDIANALLPPFGMLAPAAPVIAACSTAAAAVTLAEWRRALIVTALVASLVDGQRVMAGGGNRVAATTAANATATAVVADALALGHVPGALPAAQQVWPGTAAGWAGGVAPYTDVAVAAVESAVEAAEEHAANPTPASLTAMQNAHGGSTAVASEPYSAVAVYSYGVRSELGNYRHYFQNPNYRHPRFEALIEYSGRGWLERRNTSVDGWHAQQPDPFPLAGAFVSGDNVAIGWDILNASPLQGTLTRECSLCGRVHFVT